MPGAKKSASETAFIPGKNGGRLLPGGKPGNKGGGRTPDEFKALCRALATRDATVAAVTAILSDPTHQHYMSALKWAAEHGYGKPKETVEHTGEVKHGVVILPPVMATAAPKSVAKHGKVSS